MKTRTSSPHHLDYSPSLTKAARELRQNLTPAEKKLWYDFLRFYPCRVFRQKPIGNYIVDFYCPTLKLVIEIDGETHYTDQGKLYDEKRTDFLELLGLKVMRFMNEDVLKRFEGVCEILNELNAKRQEKPK